jgi:hypothetical protein
VFLSLWGLNTGNVCGQSLLPTHWSADPEVGYSGAMSVVTTIQIDGVQINSEEVELGAFFAGDDGCRGSERAFDYNGDGNYFVMLTVQGENGEAVYFKVYDHAAGKEYLADVSLTFDDNGSYGTVLAPETTTVGVISFTLTIDGNITNGSVSASPSGSVEKGDPVTLTIVPASGYEPDAVSAYKTGDPATTVALTGSGDTRTFIMPAYGVTVTATFKKTADLVAVETAQGLIESGSYTVAQATANTEATVKTWLASQINALAGMSATGITITESMITVSGFTAAVAGTSSSPNGTNGSFTFTVALSKGTVNLTTAGKAGTITATPYTPPATYAVTIAATINGTVTPSATSAPAGETVTLTVAPASGYELDEVSAFKTGDPATSVTILNNEFVMPAYDVTISATFKKTEAQLDKEAVEAAKAAIESETYRVAQATANDAASVKAWLVDTLNTLFGQSHDMELRSAASIDGEVAVTAVAPATEGTESNPSGVDGTFAFTVILNRGAGNATATVTGGVIIATLYSPPTGIVDAGANNDSPIRAVSTSSGLQVRGLVPGEMFGIYDISGRLQFKGKATAAEQLVPLRERGVYIAVSGNRRVKAVY